MKDALLLHPVILCGGNGTRLWPESRVDRPKPFLPLVGTRTLFQQALDRVADREVFSDPIIVAGDRHASLIEEQAGESAAIELILEPTQRNTSPAIALAATRLDPDSIMLVCPSDQHIADDDAFLVAATAAARLASLDRLVTFGITPTRPETGFGYIEHGAAIDGGFEVNGFVEKPDWERAKRFFESGNHSWNGGIFAFRAGLFLEELERYRPAMAEAVKLAVASGEKTQRRFLPEPTAFNAILGESVDYAVMENTSLATMVPVDMGWSDVGNWAALQDLTPVDSHGNAGGAEHDLEDCKGVYAKSDGPRISAIGLEDICIVVSGNEVLVTSRDGAQKVGKLPGAQQQ